MESTKGSTAVLLISCPDQTGLIANVTQFIHANNGNILHLDQHVDAQENVFLMRLEWALEDFWIPRDKIGEKFGPTAERYQMTWELRFSDVKPRLAVWVSKQSHCLYDILSRWATGEWNVEISAIVSNHPDLEPLAQKFGIDYHHIPVTKETAAEAEEQHVALMDRIQVDLIVLARYMQILSESFVAKYPRRIINIHHSFLPAFAGAKPYHAAYRRGVKIVGATSHYVTAELDAGPIIEQDVVRISHKDSVRDLLRKGRDLEKVVLARAIWHHLQHNVLVYGNKTVVFGT